MSRKQKRLLIKILSAAAMFVAANIAPEAGALQLVLFSAAYLTVGGGVLLKAARNILRGSVFDESFLMSVATIGAFAIGEYSEGVFVMLFFQVGELLESYAVGKSRKSVAELMNIRPDYANLFKDGAMVTVNPEEVEIGDEIIIKAGERVPLDGVIASGFTAMDTSALTGESLPCELGEGDSVVSGCVNLSGTITVRVTKKFGESTVARILDLVENAAMKKAHAENFITKFSRYYTPVVVAAAVVIAVFVPLFTGEAFSVWLKNALIFLVVSCPCALVISVPLAFFAGIGGASRRGILVKGSNYFEILARCGVVVFDKTGTLTKGQFSVKNVLPANGTDKDTLMELAAAVEKYTLHPMGKSIRDAYTGELPADVSVTELAGKGVKGIVYGKTVCAGNLQLLKDEGVDVAMCEHSSAAVYVSCDGVYIGRIDAEDTLKSTSKEGIDALKRIGIGKTVMLTGDREQAARHIADELGVDEVYASLLPEEKVNILEKIISQNKKGSVIYVGDGINDAPVLARADAGIGMGSFGSDAAIEAADVVLMDDDPVGISRAIKISKKTLAIVWENIAFSLGVKGIVLVLGAFGAAQMWQAVFADVGVSFIAILNSLRALKNK